MEKNCCYKKEKVTYSMSRATANKFMAHIYEFMQFPHARVEIILSNTLFFYKNQ